MDHKEIVIWLEQHAGQVHGDAPAEVVTRCEDEVRRHAAEHAWMAARAYVEGRMHEWEHQWGGHAVETDVAREVCPMLAKELKSHEPDPGKAFEDIMPAEQVMSALEPEARAKLAEWLMEVAADVEHQIWREIVRFTKRDGKAMVRDGRASSDGSWEGTENYAGKAAHIAEMLMEDYEQHATARER